MRSRLFEEHEVNEIPEDDYFDVLIAAIQIESSQEDEDALLDHQYLEEIVMLPSSSQVRKKTAQDKDQDKEIKWVQDLISQHGQEKPKIVELKNSE